MSGYGRFYVIEIKTKLKLISLAVHLVSLCRGHKNEQSSKLVSVNCLVGKLSRSQNGAKHPETASVGFYRSCRSFKLFVKKVMTNKHNDFKCIFFRDFLFVRLKIA